MRRHALAVILGLGVLVLASATILVPVVILSALGVTIGATIAILCAAYGIVVVSWMVGISILDVKEER